MSGDRREFLGAMLAAGLVPELVGRTGGQEDGSMSLLPPDLPTSRPPEQFDMSWTSKLTGTHRAVFDWFEPNGSAGVWRAPIWRRQVIDTLGVKPEDTSVVLVIRHAAIPMIMQDDFWLRHKLGKVRKLKDPMTGKTVERNPYLSKPSADKPTPPGQDFSIDGLLKSGGIVLACGFAFGAMVGLEAKLQQKKASEVRAEVQQQIIPGIVVQPSGFFALIEAQRNGCGYFPAEGGG